MGGEGCFQISQREGHHRVGFTSLLGAVGFQTVGRCCPRELGHMGASDVFFQLGRGSVAVTEFSLLWEGMPAPPGERGPPPPGVYASQPAFISLCHLSWGAADKSGFLYSPLLEDLLD